MSASAGRVLLIPKGDYNSATTYNMLDVVYYSGKSYVCKQTSVGHDPTETTYWQIMVDGASKFSELSDVQLTNVQDGDGIYYNGTAQKWKNTTPTSIAITSAPTKVDYISGESLDLTGMVVTAYYTGGLVRNITTECTFSPANGATLGTENTSVSVSWRTFSATQAITVISPIYGVEWDGTSSPAFTRTDNAVGFTDPVPYYSGMTDTPSSPFDNIMPWSGMVVEERTGGTMVKIPKFYYKITNSGASYKLQISPDAKDGFHISPTHMDRGDGQGERDYVYVGRYASDASTYKSLTGKTPWANQVRANAAYWAHTLGTDYFGFDYATLFTIWLLYLVEFASWDSQTKLGLGCKGSSIVSTGYTDSMPYHTGTSLTSRNIYGAGIQYRHIEGLWDNIGTWIAGIYNTEDSDGTVKLILNPENFNITTAGVEIYRNRNNTGTPSTFNYSDVSGAFPMITPYQYVTNNYTVYVCDHVSTYQNSHYISTGNQMLAGGLFAVASMGMSSKNPNIGMRIIELPSNS